MTLYKRQRNRKNDKKRKYINNNIPMIINENVNILMTIIRNDNIPIEKIQFTK